jgi:hypothetical protein
MTGKEPVNQCWGLLRYRHRDQEGLPQCVAVRGSVAELNVFAQETRQYPLWRIVPCPAGVHGGCGGKFACLE